MTDVRLRPFGAGVAVLGALGLAAAFTLTLDRIRLLEDPSYVPSCNFNPILSCGTVMVTDQAAVFGFPNPLLGVVGFTVVVVVGVLLVAGATVPRWVLAGLAGGSVAGLVFVHWLAFQSIFRIGALCPWCLVVWVVTIPLAVLSVLVALRSRWDHAVLRGLWSVRYLLVLAWYLAFLVPILTQFWHYWRTLV